MKILVLGCKGQLGRCLNDQLVNTEHEVIYTSREQIDIADFEVTKSKILEFSPDLIINATAYTAVDKAEEDQKTANLINHLAVKNIADICNQQGCWLVHVSTDYVFDGIEGPYGEDDGTNPISVYGQTKLAADEWLTENHVKTTILRANVVYGYTKQTKASFVKWVVDSLSDGKPIRVVDDQWNNPTWTHSVASVIKVLIETEAFGLYNYGDKGYMNRFEFAQLIAKVFELDPSLISPISTVELNQPASRPLKSGLKTEKIESALGIVPKSVETCLQEIRKHLCR